MYFMFLHLSLPEYSESIKNKRTQTRRHQAFMTCITIEAAKEMNKALHTRRQTGKVGAAGGENNGFGEVVSPFPGNVRGNLKVNRIRNVFLPFFSVR